MTSSGAVPDPGGRGPTPVAGGAPSPAARGGSLAPHPRLEPADAPAEVEPTTGAPADAVPRRVPIRQRPPLLRGPDDGGSGWAPIEEVHWDGTPLREEPARRAAGSPTGRSASRRDPARPPQPPRPLAGLAALLVLSLLAAFFAGVSAGPFWVAVGHGSQGTVMITSCTGAGLSQRCRGVFLAEEDRFVAHGVRVSGVPAGRTAGGTTLPARMTGPDGATAYADAGAVRHLRWLLGLLLVLVCAAGITRWTGATRLPDPRHRRLAVGAALAGPALIAAGLLAAAW